MDDQDLFTAWACFCCTPETGEAWEVWLLRAKAEYEATFHPDNSSAEKGHGGYGLKPDPL